MSGRFEQPPNYGEVIECRRCGSPRPRQEINVEGVIHFGGRLECIDRKACERRRRKAGRPAAPAARVQSRHFPKRTKR